MNHLHGQAKIDAIMDLRFGDGTTPRSTPYMQGVRNALQQRAGCNQTIYPRHEPGTAEFDAYYAGIDEGRRLWEDTSQLNYMDERSELEVFKAAFNRVANDG